MKPIVIGCAVLVACIAAIIVCLIAIAKEFDRVYDLHRSINT